jgi:hypothetical protein
MAHIADASTTGPSAAGDWKRQELLAAYVGPAWGDYEKTYQRLLEGGSGLGWSWSLFFFPWMWLTFRKVYLAGIAVWVLDTLARPVGWWLAAIALLAHVAVAVCGKAYFLGRAMVEVDTVRAAAPSDPVAFDRLKDAGIARGVGLFGVVILLLVITAIISSFHMHLDFHF